MDQEDQWNRAADIHAPSDDILEWMGGSTYRWPLYAGPLHLCHKGQPANPRGKGGKTGQNRTLGEGGGEVLRYSDVRKRIYFILFGVSSARRMMKTLQQSTLLRLMCTRFFLFLLDAH